MSEKTIQEMADEAVARSMADFEAARRPIPPTPEEELALRLNAAAFNDLVAREALFAGVDPRAVRHVARDAATIFALHDGALVPKGGQTDPGDPLMPLSPRVWLDGLAKTEPYLFAAPERAH